LFLLTIFAGLLLANTAFPGYLDQAEPNIATVAWLVRQGEPLYHSFDSADRYSLLYGPGTYLPYAAALWTEWTLSEESQKYVASLLRGPVALKHPYLPESMKIVTYNDAPPDVMKRLLGAWNQYVAKRH